MRTQTQRWVVAILLGLGIGFLLGVAARADVTNTAAQTEKEHGVKVVIGTEKPPLTTDVMDKLSPEQIFELEKIKAAQPEVPSLAPVIVGIVFACPVALIAVVLYYRHRRNRLLHQTLASMIDKGVPIPPELLQPERGREQPRDDLRNGLVLIGVGLGLIFFFLAMHNNVWGVGFIPLMIGVGRLIAWKLAKKNGNG